MEYNFRDIERKWQQQWAEQGTYTVSNDSDKPKYYVLDMFPYPSGAGLHVGHPLGYIASDIFARYKRLKGFNVLHPMGYDAFGLPAEQYAIEHGVHPAVSTAKNISTFRSQLDKIGFCFDWSREVNTSQPGYYKWTQWIFLQLFKSWYNRQTQRAESITALVQLFKAAGNALHPCPGDAAIRFTADEWKAFPEKEQQDILMNYRLAYCGYGEVNWCEALGTVLANDEVVNGVSERGGYPVVKKKLRQWYLRITEYADRLLDGLQTVDFSDAMKEMQGNWIGKSVGAEIEFNLTPGPSPSEMERGVGPSIVEEPYPKYGVKDKIQYENARRNRKEHTEAEAILWEQLRDKKLGVKFRRQHPVDGFIADFACLQEGLIIEVDGGYHETAEQQQYDEQRTQILQQKGFTILRFTNQEITENVYLIRDKIKQALTAQKESNSISDPTPLSISDGEGPGVRCYTTRPDTIFGVDFLVIAPEHELVERLTTPEQKAAVEAYIAYVKSRSERERMAEKKITGVFTGAYVSNPFDEEKQIPVWISEYVLAGYGTGAIMAVPCGDERDFKFAKHFNLPITNILGAAFNGEQANATKEATLQNSGFLTGTPMREAIDLVVEELEERGAGQRKVNYKMRDAAFSRQRYWGEPFPIKWMDGIAYPLEESELPLELPHVESYGPGPDGEGPLANIPEWTAQHLETNTMPGYAGSSWYFLRYMDPHNDAAFCDKKVSDYWNQVDLYVGGTEHAVGHLLYSRMWTKALCDLGLISFDEPFKKLLNQGMIQGSSRFIYRVEVLGLPGLDPEGKSVVRTSPTFISSGFKERYQNGSLSAVELLKIIDDQVYTYGPIDEGKDYSILISPIHVDVNFVDGVELDMEALKQWRNGEYANAEFILEDGKYICGAEVEKMSKSKFNTVNPDMLVEKYGADTFRMYEMFLGPVEMSKPWDTKGIEGVHRFLKKLWRLFADEQKGWMVRDEKATPAELKVLHRTIKKIEDDTERFSFNTAVSAFMVCVNELLELKCSKREILEPLVILLAPYAPHIAEELYAQLRKVSPTGGDLEGAGAVSVLDAAFPRFNAQYLTETTKEYPISVNGKMRTQINIDLNATPEEVEQIVLGNEVVRKWTEGKPPKKVIYVKNKMVNIVI